MSPRASVPGFTSPPSRMRLPGATCLLDHVGRRVEEHDRVLQREQHERGREAEHAQARADQGQPSLLARHASLASSAFQPQLFHQLIKPAELVGIVAERAARVGRPRTAPGRGRPLPYRRAPAAASPRGRSRRCFSRSASRSTMPRTMAARSSGFICFAAATSSALGPGADALGAAPGGSNCASASRTIGIHGEPGRMSSSMARQIAAAFSRLPVLLGGDAEEEARLGVPGVVRQRALEGGFRLGGHDAVRRRHQRLRRDRPRGRRSGR